MTATHYPKNSKTLISIPLSIRARIFSFALENNTERCTRKRRKRPCVWCKGRCPSYAEPPLLQVSRQIRSEMQDLWYSNTTFYFHDGLDKLLEFLKFLGNHKTVKLAHLKDGLGFGKKRYATKWLDEAYERFRSLGIMLNEGAIEVTCKEGLRLVKSTAEKDITVSIRKGNGWEPRVKETARKDGKKGGNGPRSGDEKPPVEEPVEESDDDTTA